MYLLRIYLNIFDNKKEYFLIYLSSINCIVYSNKQIKY